MTRHTEYPFWGKDHCRRPELVSSEVTSAARFLFVCQNHVVKVRHVSGCSNNYPQNAPVFTVPYRFNPFEMACFTRHMVMGGAGHFFIMGEVAGRAGGELLVFVGEARRTLVTNGTGHGSVWGTPVTVLINQRNKGTGYRLRTRPRTAVAMEAQYVDFFLSFSVPGATD